MNPIESTIVYQTGITPAGVPLIGGIWKLWEQEGFPVEMSHLVCQGKGWAVDWREAMLDASRTNNLPALAGYMEEFLPKEAMVAIKLGFMRLINSP